jgi:hypothetical protein
MSEPEKRRGGTRKIGELPPESRPCRHPEHNPPGYQVFRPGIYEHACPGCGKKQTFTVGHGPQLCAM